jgi:BirA family biotin operon repressor/biotin-[acetyl-CoA-carboxylase] ligase
MALQPTILHFESIDSTNLEAMRQARDGAPDGLCVVARQQTRGRGRLDRTWQSPLDAGLYMSLLLRPQFEMSSWPLITLMAAVAVHDALVKTCGLNADIKWPNDLCWDQRKLCGILAETVDTDRGAAAIVGIGINLKSDPGFPSPAEAVSIESATGVTPKTEAVLGGLLGSIGTYYEFLPTPSGREHLIREWCDRSSYAFGRRVRVALPDEIFEGTTRGIESDGALRVETVPGHVRVVRAGDVTGLRSGT